MAARKPKPKARLWPITERAVEEGVTYALARVERGKEALSVEQVTRHVMAELAEVLDFG